VLLYPVLDARYGSGLSKRRAQRVMTREERETMEAFLPRIPRAVEAWSDGLAAQDPFDLVVVRRPLKSLSASGNGRWWVGPREVRSELADVAATGAAYDSVYAMWPAEPSIEQCGWGCSLGPSDATFGAGFSSISTASWRTLDTDPDPEQGYVHEWLHQVEAVYRALGMTDAELPPLHDAAQFTSTRPSDEPPFGGSYADYHDGFDGRPAARTWSPWYRDWMTGRLRPVAGSPAADRAGLVDAPIGLTPDRWARRGAA
jgi:hypothetical protein